jgi:cardiolipin synthase
MGAGAFFALSGLPGSTGRPTPAGALAALALVLAASLTDYLDGAAARRAKRVAAAHTESEPAPGDGFGRWIDAFADFFLFLCAFGALTRAGLAPAWLFALFVAREATMYLIIRPASVRLGLDHGAKLAGKIKTVLQYAGVIGLLALLAVPPPYSLAGGSLDSIVLVTLTVLIAASLMSLYWYLRPLISSWPAPQRGLPQQLLATLLALTVVQVVVYWSIAPDAASWDLFATAAVLYHVLIGAVLFWRHDDFTPVAAAPLGRPARLTMPNALTLLRLSSIPTLTVLWGHGPRGGTAPVLIAITAGVFLTDLVDGALARRRGQVTTVGGYLDSGSDYLALLALAGLLAGRGILPPWLGGLLIVRLVLNAVAMAVIKIRRRDYTPGPTTWGKISVAAAMTLITAELLVHAAVAPHPPAPPVSGVMRIAELGTAAILAISLADKVRYFLRALNRSHR